MADTPNYANSPLVNLSSASGGGDYSKSPLANPDYVASLVKREQALPQETPVDPETELRIRRASVKSRSADEIIQDAMVGAASGLTGMVGGLTAIGTKGVGAAVQKLSEPGSLGEDIGGVIKDYGVALSGGTNTATQYIDSYKTDSLQETNQLTAQIGQIKAEQSAKQEVEDLANGDSEFIASLKRVGRDALNFGELTLSDSSQTGDVIASALGSLGPSAKVVGAGEKLITGSTTYNAIKMADAIAPTLATKAGSVAADVARAGAIATGVGVTEASGAYQQTVSDVMSRSHEELLATSQDYIDLLNQGLSPERAKSALADSAGQEAFDRQLLTAGATGLVLGQGFNANPVKVFEGKGFIDALKEVGEQTLEEGIQSGTGQLNQNIAIQNQVDGSQTLAEGVGEQTAVGAIGGFGMAGVLAGPSVVPNTLREQEIAAQQKVAQERYDARIAKSLADRQAAELRRTNPEGAVKDAFRAPLTASEMLAEKLGQATSMGVDAVKEGIAVAGPVLGAVADTVKDTLAPLVSQALTTTKEAAGPMLDQVKNYAEKSDLGNQANAVVASVQASLMAKKALAETTDPSLVPETVRSVVETPATNTVPKEFQSNVVEGGNLLDTVTGVLQSLTDPNISISNMSETAVTYAAEKLSQLQAVATELPAQIQSQVKKVLSSPDFKRVQTRLANINLNQTQTAETEITPEVKATTVSVAKLNPGNVNPDVVGKILEQDDRTDLTDTDVKLLGAAAKVAKAINDRVGRMVQISQEKVVSLQARGGSQEAVKSADQISRSIQVSGMTGSDGSKLRSVNDFAADVFKGSQAPNKKVVGKDGIVVPVTAVANQFKMFVQHMTNKVEALNQSYDQNNDKGRGPSIGFTSLVNGREMRNADQAGSAQPVAYHKGSEKSVEFAKTVHADAVAAAEVYNTLVETFPELFPEGKVAIPTLRGVDQTNTTAVEEVAPATSEQTENTQEQTPQTTAVEGEVSPRETSTEPQETKTETKQADLFETVSAYEKDVISTPMDPAEKAKLQGSVNSVLEILGLPLDFVKELAVLTPPKGDPLAGMAYWKEGLISLIPSVFQNLEKRSNFHILVHEIMHLVDFKAGKGDTLASSSNPEFNILDGEIWAEVDQAVKTFPRWEKFFTYANSQTTPEVHAQELFAEIGAITVLAPELAKQLFPKGSEYVVNVIKKAGGSYAIDEAIARNTASETGAAGGNSEQLASAGSADEGSSGTQDQQVASTFEEIFSEGSKKLEYSDANTLLDLVEKTEGGDAYVGFAKPLVTKLVAGLQDRLTKIQGKMSKSDKEEGTKLVRFKPMMLIDPTTGLYNERLVGLAAVAVVDWLTSARGLGAGRLQDTLEDLGLTEFDLDEADIRGIMNSVPVRQTAESVAKDILKLWNVKPNPDASMVDIRGVTEGLVKELLVVLNDTTDFVNLIEIKVSVDKEGAENATASAIEVTGMAEIQKELGIQNQAKVQKTLRPEESIMASIGEPIKGTDQTQSRGDVALSDLEKAALKKMQDTPHYLSQGITNLVDALGFDNLKTLLGWREPGDLASNHPLRVSIEGKNLSIARDFEDAMAMVSAVGDTETPVFYPVGISKVGRHQMKGINPQNNKILRALITPTHSKLDMTTKAHQDAFWITVAQASGLAKVENELHSKILATIQNDFRGKYGQAVNLIGDFLAGGELDGEALVQALGSVEMAQLNAIYAVAELDFAAKNNKLQNFETSLSFELDGKTDGPGNMMSNFGQGELTEADYTNFQRVGYFLGQKFQTLNNFFTGKKNIDLYETTSNQADKRFYDMISKAPAAEKAKLYAIQRFAGVFGDFKILEDGSIVMTRNTSKNPMTKTVYGSGVKGVGDGVAQAMMLGFYEKLVSLPEGTDLAQHFRYPNIETDIELLFGQKLPAELNINTFKFNRSAEARFMDLTTTTIGTILSETAKSVIGDKISEVNDLLVFITGVQTQFIQQLFERKLAELVELRASEGKISRNKQGKGVVRELSQRDYNDLVAELRAYAPVYSNGSQTLSIGTFSGKPSDIEMSMTMDSRLRVKSTLPTPDLAGVKVIPYISIGRGDASMMNTIYGSENAPSDTIPVFDGIDMPIEKIALYANQINEAVSKNWDANVLGDVLADFSGFLAKVGANEDLLQEAVVATAKKAFKSSVVQRKLTSPQDLLETLQEAVRQNQARKAVFKKIPLSVDHMGGSNTSFVRNEKGDDLTLAQINQMISAELDGLPAPELVTETVAPSTQDIGLAPTVEETEAPIVVTDALTVLAAMEKETRNKNVRETVKALKAMMGSDLKVVMGTMDQIQKYHSENGGNATLPNKKGMYDVETNTVYLTSDNHETMAHELIHMATFQAVLAHYNGQPNSAVERLEKLMEEFMELDFSQSNKALRDAYNSAKAQIIRNQQDSTPFSKAAALNEFMAWTLSNEALMKELKQTPTSAIAKLSKLAMALIKRVLGLDTVPSDMYSNILFNTLVIHIPNSGDGNNNGGNNNNNNGGNGNNGVTPPANNFTNFWIDRVRDILEKTNDPANANGKEKRKQIEKYITTAKDLLVKLDFGGFGLSEYQKQTFMAIHAVMATEMRLDTNSLLAMGKIYDHVTNNLTPSMFGSGQAAQDKYSTVMEMMGGTKNDEGVSDAIAVLLALSQTSPSFRAALDQIPQPQSQNGIEVASLNELLTSVSGFLMRKAIGTIDMADKSVSETLDQLSASIIDQDQQREFALFKGLMASFAKADEYASGALSKLANLATDVNRNVQNSTRPRVVKALTGSVALATSFLDKDLAEAGGKGLNDLFHMGERMDWFVPLREFISEAIGTNKTNEEVVALLDRVQSEVQAARQAYREDLPVILQNEFQSHPTDTQWRATFHVLGKTDFASIFDLTDPDESMTLLSDQVRLNRKISEQEKTIRKNFPKVQADLILEKAQQLADFQNGKGAGFQLWKNAYAIFKLSGGGKDNLIPEIDRLVTLYAINGTDKYMRKDVVEMHDEDPTAVHNLIVYMQGLNKEEDLKDITEAARLNGYKGYIPNHGSGENSLVIEDDAYEETMKRRGYVRVADYTAEDGFSAVSRGYYTTTVKQMGNYSQGVLQQVQDSYRGVNATTGLTVSGMVSGVIAGVDVQTVTDELNKVLSVADPKETLIPVFDETGVLYYERAINPDLFEQYGQPESNLALMLGSWAGRQVEEKTAQKFNEALVDRLKEIWDTRAENAMDDDLFVNMMDPGLKDPIYKESWKVIPPQTKSYILSVFGEDMGFMVPRSMINLALGYRDPSITDVWSGKTRLPEPVRDVVKAVSKMLMGDKAMVILSKTEEFTQTAVSTAKDLIVVRSVVVPYMNTQANVFQLTNRGVALKSILKGYKTKFAEIDQYNANVKDIIALNARIRLAGNDANRVAVLQSQRQVIYDENARMSISPLVSEGLYKNISEGITDLDVSITSGKLADWVEGQVSKLPSKLQTVVKYGMLSKDTALYKGANKAVQYGDFIARSIYYDHLVSEKGFSHSEAIAKVNSEFVNFSVLPGRMRSYLESIGATWFLTFKIRSMKVAAETIRENPLRSLIVAQTGNSPITDNLGAKVLDGGIDYSLGWDMLFNAPAMNPWNEFLR